MKKYIVLIISLFLCPFIVFARSANSSVLSNGNLNTCSSSSYQDSSVDINNDTYFSHCMIYHCNNGTTEYYDSKKSVKCTNGNSNPYVKITNNGCDSSQTYCNSTNEIKYCSIIVYYDCNKKRDGSSFTTTTTTKITTKKTTKIYNTTTTTTTKVINNKLSSITLSSGSIDFNSDVYEYSIDVDSIVNSINVSAIPVDPTANITVTGNEKIDNGSVISITVMGSDNSSLTYNIKVNKKEEELSSNALLSKLTIEGYNFTFNKKINNYPLIIDKDTSSLKINYVVEDSKASVIINGNDNLKSGSKVEIIVKAEDGTENKYIIDITVKKDSNILKVIFIILLVLAIIAGGYYLYKKLMGSKLGEKYEYE